MPAARLRRFLAYSDVLLHKEGARPVQQVTRKEEMQLVTKKYKYAACGRKTNFPNFV